MRLRPCRAGFTLLEVLLAMAIGVLLMAGLYTALHMTLRHAQAGRERVEQSAVGRALLARIANDIAPHLAPSRPAASSGQGSGGQGGAGATTDSGTSSSGGSTSNQVQGLGGSVTFNLGVQGNSSMLVLYVSRVPSELDPTWLGGDAPTVSDLRRITYWLSNSGLSRQEIKLATSDDASGVPSDLPDDPSLVIADEVQSVTFEYWDGSAWQDSWDGTQPPSTGGNNPQGPPLAIAITLQVAVPGSGEDGGAAQVKTYRHVVPIATANGTTQTTLSSTTSQ